MSTLVERLNIAVGNVSDELSFEIIVANKKNMKASDFIPAIEYILNDEDLSDSELSDVCEFIMNFGATEKLPFGGEISIWFDADIK